MRVFVTGKEGQLVRSLVERARQVEGLDIVAAGRPEFDMEDPGAIARAIDQASPDAVINAAAYTAVDRAEDEPERAFRINAYAAGEAATAAHRAGVPIIQVSTDYVFDGQGSGPYHEDSATAPIGTYGRSKLAGEELVRAGADNHLILRTAWVYSPFGSNFLKTMMALAERNPVVKVVADQRGNPSSALDLADGLISILQRWRGGERIGVGRTYHLAGTGDTSWADFARAVFDECRELGLPFAEVEPIASADWPTKAIRPANSTLDSSRFRTDFDFEMPHWRRSSAAIVRRLAFPGTGA
ncbi:MAG: dTDP-4-dehydrorhamnose reductase [Allosphingosinicella sp.]